MRPSIGQNLNLYQSTSQSRFICRTPPTRRGRRSWTTIWCKKEYRTIFLHALFRTV